VWAIAKQRAPQENLLWFPSLLSLLL